MRHLKLFLILSSSLAALSGCRPLDEKSAAMGGDGPRVQLASPRPEEILPVRWRVVLSAEDVDGVQQVSLSCGPEGTSDRPPLHTWTAGPYEADLDLTPCLGGSASTQTRVELRVLALDGVGNAGTAQVVFVVDRSLPSVVAQLPSRVGPRQQVPVRLETGSALAGPPVVRVDGAPLPLVAKGSAWEGAFTAPALGAAAWTGAGPAPASVLEDLEETVTVTVSARSAAGNELSFTREVAVSVVAWERDVAARLIRVTEEGHLPVATAEGLAVAVQSEDAADGGWLPARLVFESGALQMPELPEEFTAHTFGADGRPVLHGFTGTGTPVLVKMEWNGQLSTPVPAAFSGTPTVRLPDRTCHQVAVTGGCGGAVPTYKYQCADGSSSPVVSPASSETRGDLARFSAVSGAAAVSLAFEGCFNSPEASLFWDGTVASSPTLSEVEGGFRPIQRLLPVGDKMQFTLTFHSKAQQKVVTRRLDATGFMNEPAMLTADRDVLFVRPGTKTVVTATEEEGKTRLELFIAGHPGPSGATVLLPGLFRHAGPAALAPTQLTAAVFADDRALYLGRTHSHGRAVVALNPDLSVAYVYRYPRATSSLTLVQGPERVYLVDADNDRVTALHAGW
jgi:hypothetical protein